MNGKVQKIYGTPWHEVEVDDLASKVLVQVGQAGDGRLICTGLAVDSERGEITSRSLRRIPIPEILSIVGMSLEDERNPGSPDWVEKYRGPRLRPGPKGHSREHFEKVAAAYREVLVRAPRSPIATLAKCWPASEATIRRWVQRARGMGLLA